ncbi:hypothetical protein B4N89_36285 [Embleya scabrispora]|uniref:Glycosyltransferase 2-like domain-containing protein n=1 Tax=Embleya scabrispora TaxID=159449 RepID=A0A1T3NLY4_9ACTN|nr:glycosyltransferase [Embleya scabrispora]OPC77750.1 hypothetical protein B4N89_36285 [Embleya scabrispora]
MSDESVAVVIVTYNRRDMLRESLKAYAAQSRPVDEIIVVDNASSDDTGAMLAAEFPDVTWLRLEENTGPAGGYAAGLSAALERGHGWMWLFNDDDRPLPTALEELLEEAARLPGRTGILGTWLVDDRGERSVLGLGWRHRHVPAPPPPDGGSYPVDVLIFAGALVSAALVAEVGVPKAEYFAMCEELEFCLRARRAGWGIRILPRHLTVTLHEGAAQDPLWRLYYQTRNQLLMSVGHRSPAEVFFWAVRQGKFTVATLLWQDRKARRLRMRARGAWDGARGVTGRTVDPRG